MDSVTEIKLLFFVAILATFWYCAKVIRRRNAAPLSVSFIDLDDLLIDPKTNRVSKAAFVMMVAFAVTTYILLLLTFLDKLAPEFWYAYLTAWVAPVVTKIVVDGKQSDSDASTSKVPLISADTVKVDLGGPSQQPGPTGPTGPSGPIDNG